MLKLLRWCVALIAVTFFASAFAVEESYVTTQTQEFMQALEAKTNLSSTQKDEVQKIITNSIEQREEVIAKYKGQTGMVVKMQIRNELEPMKDATGKVVKDVLDEQQYEAFIAVQEDRQQQLRDRINSEF